MPLSFNPTILRAPYYTAQGARTREGTAVRTRHAWFPIPEHFRATRGGYTGDLWWAQVFLDDGCYG